MIQFFWIWGLRRSNCVEFRRSFLPHSRSWKSTTPSWRWVCVDAPMVLALHQIYSFVHKFTWEFLQVEELDIHNTILEVSVCGCSYSLGSSSNLILWSQLSPWVFRWARTTWNGNTLGFFYKIWFFLFLWSRSTHHFFVPRYCKSTNHFNGDSLLHCCAIPILEWGIWKSSNEGVGNHEKTNRLELWVRKFVFIF